ncbi:hypothetical protein RND81_14G016200 [Saponaria officinalis]|uniref:Uncharacterized protein n=1 Tax=Saponaria officinalis TaxID=3572 RepID=A0AAW1GJZ6_SAPOF
MAAASLHFTHTLCHLSVTSFRFHSDIEMGQPESSSNTRDSSTAVNRENAIEETMIQMDVERTNGESLDETRIQVDGVTSEEIPRLCEAKSSSMKAKVLDYVRVKRKFFGPDEKFTSRRNTVFLVACLVSLFVDPLFMFLPSVRKDMSCIQNDGLALKVILTVARSVGDVFYVVQIYFRFHTAYVAPTSSTFMFSRGSLMWDPRKIAVRYIKKGFLLDVIVALPLPQVMVWGVILHTSKSMLHIKSGLRYILICQYLSRLFLMFSLWSQTVKFVGAFTEAAWVGAAYNLMLSLLTSHILRLQDCRRCKDRKLVQSKQYH